MEITEKLLLTEKEAAAILSMSACNDKDRAKSKDLAAKEAIAAKVYGTIF